MSWYILKAGYHHNNPSPSWYHNIQAESKDEALLEAYRELIRSLTHDQASIPDISAILTQNELAIDVYDEEELVDDEEYATKIVIWKTIDQAGDVCMGVGFGTKSSETDKYENVWIEELEPRKNTKEHLVQAILGHKGYLGDLPKPLLQQLANELAARAMK